VKDLDGLRVAVDGGLLTPTLPGYGTARLSAMAQYREVRPRAVVQCTTVQDVARTIAYARDTGTHLVPRGGGHCFAGRSSTEVLVLDLGRLNAITVGIAGLTLGGGQFGVVTSLVFATVPEPRDPRRSVLAGRCGSCGRRRVAGLGAGRAGPRHRQPDRRRRTRPPSACCSLRCLAGRRRDYVGPAGRAGRRVGTRPFPHLCGGMAFSGLKRSFAGLGARDEGAQVTTGRSEFFARPLPTAAISALLDELTGGNWRGAVKHACDPVGSFASRKGSDPKPLEESCLV
jgi:FAD binding domain